MTLLLWGTTVGGNMVPVPKLNDNIGYQRLIY
jgi:hypothetical protein